MGDNGTSKDTPSLNGRDPATGQFVKGYEGGPGNPWVKLTHRLKSALVQAGTDDRIEQLADELWDMALSNIEALDDKTAAAKRWAMQQVLDRCLGKPQQSLEVTGEVRFTLAEALRLLRDEARVA